MRYVNLSELDYNDFVTPKTIKENDAEEEYKELLESTISTYKKLLEKGVPKEDARFVLPIASPTNITVTMNGRELLHFLDLRLEENAQWEIREVAKRMLEEVKDVAPNIFSEDI
jgi:thymidylate synthase (FAD)